MQISGAYDMLGASLSRGAAQKADNIKKAVSAQTDDEKLMESCKNLEAEFFKLMLKEMKKTVPDSGLLDKTAGHDVIKDLYYESLGQHAGENSPLGLARTIYDQFKANRVDAGTAAENTLEGK